MKRLMHSARAAREVHDQRVGRWSSALPESALQLAVGVVQIQTRTIGACSSPGLMRTC